MRFLAAFLVVVFAFVSPAEARHRHYHKHHAHQHAAAPVLHAGCNVIFPCEAIMVPVRAIASGLQRVADASSSIVAHPAGCPQRQFCGCGAAVRVFGKPVRSLWLAANWYKFSRAAPAPGMAAVHSHHVFVLEADLGGGIWRVFDANSGHHATRIHARSIRGWTVVNPRSG
jgi:hypothetical protein